MNKPSNTKRKKTLNKKGSKNIYIISFVEKPKIQKQSKTNTHEDSIQSILNAQKHM